MRTILVVFGVAVASACASRAHAELVNKILATVDGDPVTVYQLKKFAETSLRARQLSGSMDQAALLDALISEKLLEKEVSDKGIVVRDEDVDHYMEAIKERNQLDDQRLKEAIEKQGLTVETYRVQLREEIQKAQLMNREIRGKVMVTPEEVQRYYEAHISEYSTPARLQVGHILFHLQPDAPADKVVAVTAKAEEVYQRLKKGADFAEMAKQILRGPHRPERRRSGVVQARRVARQSRKGCYDAQSR